MVLQLSLGSPRDNMSTEELSPILSEQNCENEGNDIQEIRNTEEKEDWYGWVVVGASFLCNMVIDGMGYSFGVMLEPLMREFHVGAGEVAFVGSILNGVVMLSAPIAAACINRYFIFVLPYLKFS